MKRGFCLLLALAMMGCLPFAAAEGEEEDDLLIEEIIEDIDLDAIEYGDVEWDFALSLEEMDPEYIRLANKHYLLDEKYVPEMVKVPKNLDKGGLNYAVTPSGGWWYLQEACAEALHQMAADMAEDIGKKIYLKSAYRAYRTQKTMYNNRLASHGGKDDGWVSKPGASDHQTGLGCDVVPYSWRDKSMNEKMMREPECQWMAEHCQEYGFIIRYPDDKNEITEINTEPWHIRYVGIPVAQYMGENNLCLEEFCWQLQAAIQRFLDRGGDPAVVEKYIQVPTDEGFVPPNA